MKSGSGAGVGEDGETVGFQHPSARTPPTHSLGSPRRRGELRAAGRLLPPRVVLGAGRRSLSLPLRASLGRDDVSCSSLRVVGRVGGVMGYDSQ